MFFPIGNLFCHRKKHVYFSNFLFRISVASHQHSVGLRADLKDKLKYLNIPEPPKRPTSPYIRFLKEHRLTVIKQNPNLSSVEVIKQCAEAWRNVSPEKKQDYSKEFHLELAEYTQKNKTYHEELTPEHVQALSELRKDKKINKVNREIKRVCTEWHGLVIGLHINKYSKLVLTCHISKIW